MGTYWISSLANDDLPSDLAEATEQDVEHVVKRAAAFIGCDDVVVERVTSVLGGSCVVCTDVVASVRGVPVIVARPAAF